MPHDRDFSAKQHQECWDLSSPLHQSGWSCLEACLEHDASKHLSVHLLCIPGLSTAPCSRFAPVGPGLPRFVPVCPPVPANRCLDPLAPRRRRAQAVPAPCGGQPGRDRAARSWLPAGSGSWAAPRPRTDPDSALPLPLPLPPVPSRPVPSRPSPAPQRSGARKMEGYRRFLALLVSALLLGFVAVVCSLVWVFRYREGLGWDGGAAEFNWHPVLVVTGFVFVQGIAIIVYRLPWTWKCSKLLMKFIHAGLNTIAMILAIVSMVAVFEYHNARKIPNMYSLHSWIGLTAVIFYSLQLFLGFAVFLLPFAPVPLRAALMPIHVYSGLLIFVAVIASALMGITEKLLFSLPAYSESPPEAIFVNCLGLLIVAFGALILWMASRPHWKRPPEENAQVQRPNGGAPEGVEAESTMTDCSNADRSDAGFNSDAARKRNFKLDEAGQRSTM
ncbi:cytochrome b reductase 1 [Oxyura jamaicensis]|uniref:cytochrome b reductase 1 n=1 Tax=Oxyura jamaicensis TaxID=8884 RepID=UPI0015A669C4|nr:cytochrome b reductase 1 [Oxyura jamaicensis]